jgi:hypothetical protein
MTYPRGLLDTFMITEARACTRLHPTPATRTGQSGQDRHYAGALTSGGGAQTGFPGGTPPQQRADIVRATPPVHGIVNVVTSSNPRTQWPCLRPGLTRADLGVTLLVLAQLCPNRL